MELNCESVTHWYGRRRALSDVSVTLRPGLTGLLGPNGAGKSTLLGVLSSATRPTEGTVRLDGRSLHGDERDGVRRRIGYLPQRFDLMRGSTTLRNVSYAAWCQGVDRHRCTDVAMQALATVDLAEAAERRVGSLSGGQQQRVGIACAIAHRPKLILLDEPTAGLDPAQRVQIRSHLSHLAETAIVIVSTHIVEDLALLASDVIVVDDGQVLYTGPVASLATVGQSSPVDGMSDIEAGYMSLLTQRSATMGGAA